MQSTLFYPTGYDLDSLSLDTLAHFPGFIYLKSITSEYLWTNLNLSKAAVGSDTTAALKGGNDFDFYWHLYADSMRENDQLVIKSRSAIHVSETSQRSNGTVHQLTTYKMPLYKHKRLMGLLGISYEHLVNQFQLKLTPREQTCIALMAQGLTDKQIANRLGISRRTVETHFHSSKIKLNVNSRAQLIVMFCEK